MHPEVQQAIARITGAAITWVLIIGVVSFLLTVFKLSLLPKLKGSLGEASINSSIRRLLDPHVYHLIPNVMLPTPDGTTQIDHVIVSRYGVFVLETKTYKGWIFGNERDAQWTQVIYKRKERFQNPLRQNYKHTKTLSELSGIPHKYCKSIAVFAGNCRLKTKMPPNVVYARDVIRHIKSYTTPLIQDKQVPEIVGVIQEWAGTVTDQQRRRHVRNLRRNRKG